MTLYGPNGEIRTFNMPLSEADAAEVARLKELGYSETKAVTTTPVTGGGGGSSRPPVETDPNAWAKNITDPTAWVDENLGKKPEGPFDLFKLGESVARTRALAIIAESEGNTELADSFRAKARQVVEDNKALQFVPEGGMNGTSIASALLKDRNIVDNIFKTKTPDPAPSAPVQTQNVDELRTKIQKDKKKKTSLAKTKTTAIKSEAKKTGKSIAQIGREKAPSSKGKTAAQKAKDEGDPRAGLMNKGGLMNKKGDK